MKLYRIEVVHRGPEGVIRATVSKPLDESGAREAMNQVEDVLSELPSDDETSRTDDE